VTGIDHHLPPIQAQRSKGFGQKIPFHDKLTDLDPQLHPFRVAVLLARAALLVEHLGKLLDRLSLPAYNLGRMQFVLGRQLRNRFVALDTSVKVLKENMISTQIAKTRGRSSRARKRGAKSVDGSANAHKSQ
jgi:hypothetical protein